MIALFMFSLFIAVFATSNGYNLSDSQMLKEEILLKQLAENKLNELILTPPKNFSKSLTLGGGTTKTIDGFDNYESKVIYKEFFIPDFNKITGQEGGDDGADKGIQQKVFAKIKENLEKIVWQVEVTIRNKDTDFSYSISTWLYNHKAKLNVNSF
jgi:hypothetical protein